MLSVWCNGMSPEKKCHSVVRRDAVTTKVRVVFDASLHEKGEPFFNDGLDKGVKLGR